MRRSTKLAMIAVASILFVSMIMAQPVSAAQVGTADYYFAYDRAVGTITVTQTVVGYHTNSFTVRFDYQIWIAQVAMIFPAHIVHLQLEIDSSYGRVDFVNTVFDIQTVVNWRYNPDNVAYSLSQWSYTTTLGGYTYYVYCGTGNYGPTLNPTPGEHLKAYMWWWGEAAQSAHWDFKPLSPDYWSGSIVCVPLWAPSVTFDVPRGWI